jgi:hypothetical protein
MSNNPKIIVRNNSSVGSALFNGGASQLGDFVANTTRQIYVFMGNDASDSTLVIPFNGVDVSNNANLLNIYNSVLVNGVLQATTTASLPANITFQKGLFALIQLDTSIVGNRIFTIQISSNDPAVPTFTHTFYFSVVAASTTSADCNIIYNNNIVVNGGILNAGLVAKNSIQTLSFNVANFGVPQLVIEIGGISLTTISGNETFSYNPSVSQQVNLNFNQTAVVSCNLDTVSVGDRSFVVTIASNDALKPIFVFTIYYSVAESYQLVVKQVSEQIYDNQIIDIGSVNQNSVLVKTISISNSGILYSIRVSNIVLQGNANLLKVPALPFIVEPNESNTFSFNVRLNTNSLGKKDSELQIQWEVSL